MYRCFWQPVSQAVRARRLRFRITITELSVPSLATGPDPSCLRAPTQVSTVGYGLLLASLARAPHLLKWRPEAPKTASEEDVGAREDGEEAPAIDLISALRRPEAPEDLAEEDIGAPEETKQPPRSLRLKNPAGAMKTMRFPWAISSRAMVLGVIGVVGLCSADHGAPAISPSRCRERSRAAGIHAPLENVPMAAPPETKRPSSQGTRDGWCGQELYSRRFDGEDAGDRRGEAPGMKSTATTPAVESRATIPAVEATAKTPAVGVRSRRRPRVESDGEGRRPEPGTGNDHGVPRAR